MCGVTWGNKPWKTGVMFHSQYEKLLNGPLLEVNAEDVEEEISIILVGFYGVINSGRLMLCSIHSMRSG